MTDLRGWRLPVLDHGEVVLLDYMAGDHKVLGSARISKGVRPEDASKGAEPDKRLIHFLMVNGHGTPFEHAVFQFFIKTPIFVAREWQRHRIASYNEFSKRYSELEPDHDFYVPDHVRVQDPKNKQGSVRLDDEYGGLNGVPSQIARWSQEAMLVYRGLIAGGVAKEMARIILPVNAYTMYWFTVNARSLMNFLMLRNSEAALWEIRQYAIALEEIFSGVMPITHEAFVADGRRAP